MTPVKRAQRLFIGAAALLAAGLLYAVFVGATGIAVPCIFRAITGLKCPGCGMTTLCMCLLRLDIPGAWSANPAAFLMLPLGAAVAVDMSVRYIRTGTKAADRFSTVSLGIIAAVLVVYAIIRNI